MDKAGLLPPIQSPSGISFRGIYLKASEYIKCTNKWLLGKPPINDDFIQQRKQEGQKGPTRIYVHFYIRSTSASSYLHESILMADTSMFWSDKKGELVV